MKIILTKKTSLALAASLTMIVGTVNAVENMEQEKVISNASINNVSEEELTILDNFLIILGLKEEKKEAEETISKGIGECKTQNCGSGKVKH